MKELYKSSILNAWLGFATPMYALVGAMQFIVIVMVGPKFLFIRCVNPYPMDRLLWICGEYR